MQVLPEVQEAEARRVLGSWGLQGRLASHVPIGLLSGGQRVSTVTYSYVTGLGVELRCQVRLVLSRLMYSCPDLLYVSPLPSPRPHPTPSVACHQPDKQTDPPGS